MKLRNLLALLLVLPLSSFAQKDLGVGFSIGGPTGLSARKWIEDTKTIDGAAGWNLGGNPHLILQGAYTYQFKDALYFNDQHPLDAYVGVGAKIDFDDEIEIGARLPLGLSYYFNNREAEAFAEFSPLLRLIPSTDIGAQLAIGMRIYL